MLYFLKHTDTGLIKIGTTKHYHDRYLFLCRTYGDLELLGLAYGSHSEERALHLRFSHLNNRTAIEGREWFNSNKELLRYIKRHTCFNFPMPINEKEQAAESIIIKIFSNYKKPLTTYRHLLAA